MIQEFDLYDFLLEKLFFLRADKRLDLRIMIALLLKAAFFIVWYAVVQDKSKFTWIAIGMNLATWPIYHIFFFLAEFRYLTDGQIDHYIRKIAFRLTDQLQNFILLVEFCILIIYQGYDSEFHRIVVALLAVDNIIFVIQNIITCCINRRRTTSNGKISKLAKITAQQIKSKLVEYQKFIPQFEYFNQTQQQIQQIDEEILSQKIQVQVINNDQIVEQQTKQDVVFKLCYDYNATIYFESPKYTPSQKTELIFGKGDKKGLSAFYLAFLIGSFTSMTILMIVLLPLHEGQVLTIFIILEVIGNFVIVCFGCLKCCQCDCCSEICQKSFSKLILSIVEGLIFGITSVYYGIIFGSLVIIGYVTAYTIYGVLVCFGTVIILIDECYNALRKCVFCYDDCCELIALWFFCTFCCYDSYHHKK